MSIKKGPQFWELKKEPFVPYKAEHPPHLSEGGGRKCTTCGNFSNTHPGDQESLDRVNQALGGQK